MSKKTRRIRVEFGPFRIVLEGFGSPADGVDMAVQLIRRLSEQDIGTIPSTRPSPKTPAPQARSAPARPKSEKPLLLQEGAGGGNSQAGPPEFHSKRGEPEAGPDGSGDSAQWRAYIDQLEANARMAVDALTSGNDGPGGPGRAPAPQPQASPGQVAPEAPQRPEASSQTHSGTMGSAPDDPAAAPQPGPEAGAPESGLDPDGFSPRDIANADIQPADANPAAGPEERAIRQSMDLNRRAIEQAAADPAQVHGHPPVSHDYLAMEDKAIDRLLETTNALLETDEHTRKNRSLDRAKAAVVATEAERRISVKTATGTVTLDFDEKGRTRHPVADLLAPPKIDPEKRRQRLQDYRNMIAENKKRP